MFCSLASFSQNFPEPEFIGEALLIRGDSTTNQLEKTLATYTVKANATMYIFGMGTVKARIEVPGAKSAVRTNSGDISLIVRANDNLSDPMSIISVFKYNIKKGKRRAEIASAGTFTGTASGNLNAVGFTSKKYGESSYMITIPALAEGEYGIIVSNPNARDSKSVVVSSFGVD